MAIQEGTCYETRKRRRTGIEIGETTTEEGINAHHIPMNIVTGERWKFRGINREKAVYDDNKEKYTMRYEVAVSDGSVKHGRGAFSVVFATNTEEGDLKWMQTKSGKVMGNPGTMNSYIAEARWAAEVFLAGIEPPDHYYCDNKAVVEALQKETPLPPLAPEWDILEATRKKMQSATTKCHHVKGHQDRNKSKEELDGIAKLNLQADREADTVLYRGKEDYLLAGHRTTLFLAGVPVTTNYQSEIRRGFHTSDMNIYYGRKMSIGENIMDTIDFDAFGSVVEKLAIERRIRIIKFVHGWTPVHGQQNRIYSTSTTCRWGSKETIEHLYECELYSTVKKEFVKSFEANLNRAKTNRGLFRLIMHLVKFGEDVEWKENRNEKYCGELRSAYQQQSKLGISQMWRGIIC